MATRSTGSVLPTQLGIYLDPARGASYGRDDFQAIGNVYGAPFAVFVNAESKYQTVQELVAAAKAKPKKVTGGTSGFMSTGHYAKVVFEQAAGVDLATVNFQGGGPALTALLGGHIDVVFGSIGELLENERAGTIRILAVMDDERSDFLPHVPTLKEQGINANPMGSYVGVSASAKVPQDVIKVLADSLKRATEDPHVKQRMKELGNTIMYKDPAQYTEYWNMFEKNLKPLVAIAKEQSK